MKSKDVCKQYGLDVKWFEHWLPNSGYAYKKGMMGGVDVTEGQNINEIVNAFRSYYSQELERIDRENADRERSEQQKQVAMASMLITSGFNFDGYTITKYSGYISGDDAIQVPRGREGFFAQATDVGEALMAGLVQIRRNALTELKEAAYALGCNAVIGVDFDYLTLDPETVNASGGTLYMPYVFGVTANGNAVVIERNEPTGLA
jgi:uncharacterized protein YbjQ (UPF0145 family)